MESPNLGFIAEALGLRVDQVGEQPFLLPVCQKSVRDLKGLSPVSSDSAEAQILLLI